MTLLGLEVSMNLERLNLILSHVPTGAYRRALLLVRIGNSDLPLATNTAEAGYIGAITAATTAGGAAVTTAHAVNAAAATTAIRVRHTVAIRHTASTPIRRAAAGSRIIIVTRIACAGR
jgi:hypothetical protein